jgi:hypothetical protein
MDIFRYIYKAGLQGNSSSSVIPDNWKIKINEAVPCVDFRGFGYDFSCGNLI